MFLALSMLVLAIADEAKMTQLLVMAALSSTMHGLYLKEDDDDYEKQ